MSELKEGLYCLKFQSLTAWGYGLVYLAGGKIYGGDSYIYYVGTYSIAGQFIQGRVKGRAYAPDAPQGTFSLFGRDNNTIEIEGTIGAGGEITLTLRSKQAPGIEITGELEFLSE